MRMLDGNADGDLAGSRFVERIAVGIAALIDCGAGSVANTGQHRVLASELEIRLVTEIYDRSDAWVSVMTCMAPVSACVKRTFTLRAS